MNGFVGEFLILVGSFATYPAFTAVAASGVILSAVYMLWMFQRVNYGPVTNPRNSGLRDLSPREWAVIAPIVAMCIGMGVAPGVFLKPMEPAVAKIVQQVRGTGPVNAEAIKTPGVISAGGVR
jgi:NADH-quinone oxidoreductase subunit M